MGEKEREGEGRLKETSVEEGGGEKLGDGEGMELVESTKEGRSEGVGVSGTERVKEQPEPTEEQ